MVEYPLNTYIVNSEEKTNDFVLFSYIVFEGFILKFSLWPLSDIIFLRNQSKLLLFYTALQLNQTDEAAFSTQSLLQT